MTYCTECGHSLRLHYDPPRHGWLVCSVLVEVDQVWKSCPCKAINGGQDTLW